jgi:hypothetical protein
MPRRGLHNISLLGTLRERGLPVGESFGLRRLSRVVQTSEDVIMRDTYFGANNDDDVMEVSSVEAEAGSVALDSSDESIGNI